MRQQETIQSLLDITEMVSKDQAKAAKKGGLKALQDGGKQQSKNVAYGKGTTDGTVKPKEITKAFGKSAQFAADVKDLYPNQYKELVGLRQNLRDHHFDLGEQIKDVEMMATTTMDNAHLPIRKLNLRKKYEARDGKVKPNMEAKIWKYEINKIAGSIEKQLVKIKVILAQLDKIQKGCDATAGKIEILLIALKKEIMNKIKEKKVEVADLQEKLKNIKCPWWEAVFTLGFGCKKYGNMRNEIRDKMRGLERYIAAAGNINDRFNYFDHLKENAKHLTQAAVDMVGITKALEQKLEQSLDVLKSDFDPAWLEDMFEDELELNDNAELLFSTLSKLIAQCEKTITDCAAVKKRLTDALIWGKIGEKEEEALVTLAASAEAKVMAKFYELAAACGEYYMGSTNKFAQDAKDLLPTIALIGKHKFTMMNYAKADFHAVKSSVFDIADALIDAQMAFDGFEDYFDGRIKFMDKRMETPGWRYQIKYSTMMASYCERNAGRLQEFATTVNKASATITDQMSKVAADFKAGAARDLRAWDCKAMYPEPKVEDLPKRSSWLGGITKIARQAFSAYNQLKKLIPGGSKAGAGKVPGSDKGGAAEDLLELKFSMDGAMDIARKGVEWAEPVEKVAGQGLKILEDMEKEVDADTAEVMAARRKIWQAAVDMCETDKTAFKKELGHTQAALKKLTTPVTFTDKMPAWELDADLNKYVKVGKAMSR
jgi:hypothetical protein